MSDEVEKIATPRGEGRTMTELPAYSLAQRGSTFNEGGADWMGPLPPMRPIAPPEVAGRAWDFPPGYNLATQPRTFEPISFEALKNVAESYDPVRLIIQRRIDQLTRLPWMIRVKHEGAGKRPKTSALSAQMRATIRDITSFFKHPCEGLSFRNWLSMLTYDLLVYDAPSIYCERTPGGSLVALSPVDGSLIRPIIDSKGRTPRPFVWDGGPFDWLGQTITTANYEDFSFRIVDGLMWPPAYQEILHGLPAVNYSTWDLVYAPMNRRTRGVYGCSPVEMAIITIGTAQRRAISQLEYFREGNQPDALFTLPASWTPDKVQQFQDYFDSIYSGNLANRRKMKFVISDNANPYIETKQPPLKTEFDEWLIRVICFAFSYPPSSFVSLSNRSIAEAHERQAEEEGLGPLAHHIKEIIDSVIERDFDSDDIEFAWVEENEVDQDKQSKILARLVDSGIITPNMALDRLGEEPSTQPGADQLGVRTPTGRVPIGGHGADEQAADAVDDNASSEPPKPEPEAPPVLGRKFNKLLNPRRT